MKKILLWVVAISITMGFVSCTKNYPEEVNKRVKELEQQGVEILVRSNDETGAEHYVLYRTGTELVYDGIDFKNVLIKKGEVPNCLVLDIDSLSPDLISKQVPATDIYGFDVAEIFLDKAKFKEIKNGFIQFLYDNNYGFTDTHILSCYLPNVYINGEFTGEGKLSLNYEVDPNIEYFLRKVYGDTSLLNTMKSKIRGGGSYGDTDGYEIDMDPGSCYMGRSGYVDAKGNIIEMEPNYNIHDISNRPSISFEYPADQLKDKEGIKHFIDIFDETFMKEIIEPLEQQLKEEERERERQQELKRNALVNYECRHCHTIIQSQDKGYYFCSGECPAWTTKQWHSWYRLN